MHPGACTAKAKLLLWLVNTDVSMSKSSTEQAFSGIDTAWVKHPTYNTVQTLHSLNHQWEYLHGYTLDVWPFFMLIRKADSVGGDNWLNFTNTTHNWGELHPTLACTVYGNMWWDNKWNRLSIAFTDSTHSSWHLCLGFITCNSFIGGYVIALGDSSKLFF